MNESLRFYPDPAKEADELTAIILSPDLATRPDVVTSQSNGDKDYVLRSLLRRIQVMEALWFRLIGESLSARTSKERGELGRQAHALNKEMTSVLAAIYRIQRDTGCVSPIELRLADKAPPVGLSTLERVQAEAVADEVFDLEFRTIPPDMAVERLPPEPVEAQLHENETARAQGVD